jgi:hypothetical protein
LQESAVQSGSTNQETDMAKETDDDALFREIQRRRNTGRAIQERDKHADDQLKYRQRLEQKRAPTRADFSVVTLAVFLLSLKHHRGNRAIQILPQTVKQELDRAGFDREQAMIRLERMIDKCDDDLENWRTNRAWFKKNGERREADQGDRGLRVNGVTLARIALQSGRRDHRRPFCVAHRLLRDAGAALRSCAHPFKYA